MSHAPPPGPPPNRPTDDAFNDAVPDDPPPAYEAVSRTDSVVAAGPSRMDFSGPPPLPDRMQRLQPHSTGGYSIPGVGVGYNPGPSSPGGQGESTELWSGAAPSSAMLCRGGGAASLRQRIAQSIAMSVAHALQPACEQTS
jgi:hypothetical protein